MTDNYDKWDELFGNGSVDNLSKSKKKEDLNMDSKELDWLFDTKSSSFEDYSTNPTFGEMPTADDTEIIKNLEQPTEKFMDKLDDSKTNVIPSKKINKINKNVEKKTDKLISKKNKKNVPDEFDEDDEEFHQEHIISRNRQKRTGCLGGILYFVFIVGISVLLAAFAWMCASDVLAFGREETPVEITIAEDADIDAIATTLKDAGLIKYKWLFKLYGSFSHAEDKVESGTYELNTKYDYRALVASMRHGSSSQKVVEVMIPEGYSMMQIFNLLEENGVCSAESLWNAAATVDFDYTFINREELGDAKRLEGYLFPDTYNFYAGDDPESVIKKMLNNAENKYTDDIVARAEDMGYTLDQIITVASLIEKEAGNADERADVASVIYNRLDAGIYLQLDATVNYIIAGTDEPFSTEIDSPYNTYMYPGLPAGPIANPGMAAIEAALNPSSTNYYFFAYGVDGTTHFFRYEDDFYAFISSDEYASSIG